MVILITGILGSGKTSIATVLTEKLGYECVELDDLILKKTGFKSVGEAYESSLAGWKEKELETTKELSARDNMVIVCGGALIENNLNVLYFQEKNKNVKIIYLKTRPDILSERLVKLYDEFKKVGPKAVLKKMGTYYDKRNNLYEQYADLIVNTEDSTPEEAADEIMKKLKV